MFKCHRISVVGEDAAVVYRCKYNSESREWGKMNTNDPIHTADIFGYHNYPTNEEKRNELPAATMKQEDDRRKIVQMSGLVLAFFSFVFLKLF